jgi:hypothetical protein
VPSPFPEITGSPAASRRLFLQCCAAIVLAAPGCAALGRRTRLAYTFINDPPVEAYRPVLDALVAAVLPSERADFPAAPSDVATRLLTLYQLETDPRFLTVQKMLLYFEETDLFQDALPLIHQERLAIDAQERRLDLDALLETKAAVDRSLYAGFTARDESAEHRFSALTLPRRREFLNLWNTSEFLVRRQFYFSVRALVMIAAYSMEDVWAAIGYDGPLLRQSRV